MKSITSISSIPNIRCWIRLITIFAISYLLLQIVSAALGEITILSLVVLLLSLGVDILLLCSLNRALKPEHTTAALGVISVTSKALFIGGCVLFGLIGLIVLLCIILILLAGIKEAGAMWIPLALLAVPTAVIFARVKLYSYMSKVTKQMKTNEYDASEAPEKWALISAISSFILMLFMLILFLCVPTMQEVDPERKTEYMIAELANKLANRNHDFIPNLLQYAMSALQCASCFAVYLLFRTLRLNLPITKKNSARKK